MARIRTIKPEFWTSEQIAECSRDARLAFIGLWNFCDDAGRHPASVKRLKMEVFPGDAIGDAEVTRWVRELADAGLIEEYEYDGQSYWQVTGWHHQRIDQPIVKYPDEDGRKTGTKTRRLGGKQRQLVITRLIARDGKTCCNCKSPHNLTVDHIHPIAEGGTNDLDNLRLLCKLCNNEKHAKVLDGESEVTREVRAGDAQVTRRVRGGDSPPEGNGMECNGKEELKNNAREAEPEKSTIPIAPRTPPGWQNADLVDEAIAALAKTNAECGRTPKLYIGPAERSYLAAHLESCSVEQICNALRWMLKSPHQQAQYRRDKQIVTVNHLLRPEAFSSILAQSEAPDAWQAPQPKPDQQPRQPNTCSDPNVYNGRRLPRNAKETRAYIARQLGARTA